MSVTSWTAALGGAFCAQMETVKRKNVQKTRTVILKAFMKQSPCVGGNDIQGESGFTTSSRAKSTVVRTYWKSCLPNSTKAVLRQFVQRESWWCRGREFPSARRA